MHAPLPVHPVTGARALGWRKARPGEDDDELFPIWPILGGAEDDDAGDSGDDSGDDDAEDADDSGDDSEDDADPEGTDALGDKGKRALAAMKGKWKSERDKRRELEQRLSQGGEDDAAAKAVQAATAAANTRILRAEVRAAAKGRLADPKDALTFLDISQFEVDEDGQVDEDEITDAIDTLLKNKPYLAAQSGRKFQGTGDGGAARKAGRPKQLTREDLKGMSADAILKAKSEGRLDDALGITR
ncbi:hypothetical protein ACH4TI_15105 [Streptomyces rochei]|uniref:hypothetical protein n=1 Tax=Streptomyces rochei TaxID=1928 RepID=UPI0037A9C037